MANSKPMYRLVVFEAVDDPQGVRDLFCKVTGIHPTDAMQWVARVPGVWPRPLPEAETRTLLDGLYEYGVPAEAWRTDQFPEIVPPRTIHTAACLPEGFRVQGLRGEPTHWVPWDRIDLVSAGRIDTEDVFRKASPPAWTSALAVGLRAITLRVGRPPDRSKRASRLLRDPVGEVIIIRRDPLIAFRVVENQMNYAYLGDRLSPKASENFPVFLADLAARAEQADVTPPTRTILERKDPAESAFPSSQALLDYSTHRLLWCWYHRARDSRPADTTDI
jgi:hypothetical protein